MGSVHLYWKLHIKPEDIYCLPGAQWLLCCLRVRFVSVAADEPLCKKWLVLAQGHGPWSKQQAVGPTQTRGGAARASLPQASKANHIAQAQPALDSMQSPTGMDHTWLCRALRKGPGQATVCSLPQRSLNTPAKRPNKETQLILDICHLYTETS